jgi:hypothetical protein
MIQNWMSWLMNPLSRLGSESGGTKVKPHWHWWHPGTSCLVLLF